jgi:hypothetical protein
MRAGLDDEDVAPADAGDDARARTDDVADDGGMGADMRGMNMSGSAEWSALGASVKNDLADLPNLKGKQLSARMRAHAERVKRLIAMHDKMIGK